MKNIVKNMWSSDKIKSINRWLSAVLSISMLLFSCNNNDPEPNNTTIAPSAKCKVQSQAISGTGRESPTITYTYNFLFTYTYDEKGNQVGSNATYKYQYSDGKTSTSSNSISHQFDENDFVLRRVAQYSSTGKDGISTNTTTNTEYTYAEDRLIKESHTINENGKVRDYSFSYEYDTEGKVTKVSNTYNNSYSKFEWSGSRVQKMTHVDQYGNTSSPFLEYNSDGLLIKSIDTRGGYSDEYRYTYDTEGQQIRFERYINTKPSSAYVSEYDSKENPYSQLYAKFKGHPTVPSTQSDYKYKHNLTKSISYTGDPVTGEWKLNGSTLYAYGYNGKNLPLDVVVQNLDKDGVQTSTSRTDYQYQDCQ